jgi:hypothetical protein
LSRRDFENGAVRDEIRKRLRVLQLQANQAHEFCPDHRDKQRGRPCLACEVERLERLVERAGEVMDLVDDCQLYDGAADRVREAVRRWRRARAVAVGAEPKKGG